MDFYAGFQENIQNHQHVWWVLGFVTVINILAILNTPQCSTSRTEKYAKARSECIYTWPATWMWKSACSGNWMMQLNLVANALLLPFSVHVISKIGEEGDYNLNLEAHNGFFAVILMIMAGVTFLSMAAISALPPSRHWCDTNADAATYINCIHDLDDAGVSHLKPNPCEPKATVSVDGKSISSCCADDCHEGNTAGGSMFWQDGYLSGLFWWINFILFIICIIFVVFAVKAFLE